MYILEGTMILSTLMMIYLYFSARFPWDGHSKLFYDWRKLTGDQVTAIVILLLYFAFTVICVLMLFSKISIIFP